MHNTDNETTETNESEYENPQTTESTSTGCSTVIAFTLFGLFCLGMMVVIFNSTSNTVDSLFK